MRAYEIPLGFKLNCQFKHLQPINRIAWSPDGNILAAPTNGQAIRLWDTQKCELLRTLQGHTGSVYCAAWSPAGSILASGSSDGTICLWNIETGECQRILSRNSENSDPVYTLSWSPDKDEMVLASNYSDGTILWDIHEGEPLRILSQPSTISDSAHQIYSVVWSPDGAVLASGSADCTISLWDPSTARPIRILEGHTGVLTSLSFSKDSRLLASKSRDKTVRIWRTDTWQEATRIYEPTTFSRTSGLAFHPFSPILATLGEQDTIIRIWSLDIQEVLDRTPDISSIYYTNAKIALVGDSGVGKSGLGRVLIGEPFTTTESTNARKVLLLNNQEVELSDGHKEIHETLIWDLAGQPGYRLIHQLHLSEVSVALIIFDSRSETDPFAGVSHWANALRVAQRVQGASAPRMKKFLLAARIDRSGTSVSDARIEELMQNLKVDKYFAVSAKEGQGIEELKEAINEAIEWNGLPKVTSTELFQRIKNFLVTEKDAGRLLSPMDDLYRAFLRFEGILVEAEDLRAQFVTCIGLVEAKGLIRHFSFGNLVLLQPEWLDTYASALVNAARDEPDSLGSIPEGKVLAGDFYVPQDERIPDKEQEKLLLIAMVKDLLHYEIALREQGVDETYLVFLFQSTRENLDLLKMQEREKAVIFRFEGPVLNIYATLMVRLSHSGIFIKKDLWKNAISYTTQLGGIYWLILNNIGEGLAEFILFFDEEARAETYFHFEEFIKEHLQRRVLTETIQRRRVFACPNCKTPVTDLQVMKRRARNFNSLKCPVCDTEISLLDWEEQLKTTSQYIVSVMNEAANEQRDRGTARSILQGKIATNDFDVFLCHNVNDKPEVWKIGEQLKERGILPWLDKWELRPGFPWQSTLEEQIEKSKSAAVFVGKEGIGPWQQQEMDSLLHQFVKRGCPVIPVILPDVSEELNPKLPAFLDNMTWVDFRKKDQDPIGQLIWGITGERRSI